MAIFEHEYKKPSRNAVVCLKCGITDDSGLTPRTASYDCEHNWIALRNIDRLKAEVERYKKALAYIAKMAEGTYSVTLPPPKATDIIEAMVTTAQEALTAVESGENEDER